MPIGYDKPLYVLPFDHRAHGLGVAILRGRGE
jgi:hypothetical protein